MGVGHAVQKLTIEPPGQLLCDWPRGVDTLKQLPIRSVLHHDHQVLLCHKHLRPVWLTPMRGILETIG